MTTPPTRPQHYAVACTFGVTTPRSIPLTVGDTLGADQNSTGSAGRRRGPTGARSR